MPFLYDKLLRQAARYKKRDERTIRIGILNCDRVQRPLKWKPTRAYTTFAGDQA